MTQKIEEVDAIIIGSGQAGNPLASALAGKGMKTVLIEKSKVGGTCVNTGCTPTKSMIASAQVAHTIRTAKAYGVTSENVKVKIKKVIDRKNEIVKTWRKGSEDGLKDKENLELIMGKASFISDKEVTIKAKKGENRTFKADKIFINVGTHTRVPDIKGIDEIKYLDNASIMEVDQIPEHLLVLGGGYIGLEFAQMFHRFGSKVTILQEGAQIAGKEDPDVAEALTEILQNEGIDILLNAKVKSAKNTKKGIQLSGEFPDGKKSITGSHLLVATGRAPNTQDLGLENTAIKIDNKGQIQVNDKLETSVAGIYALGDVKGGPQFTHVSYNDYKIVEQNLLENGNASTNDRILTYTVFTDPQLGRAGLNEVEAKEKKVKYKVAKLPMEKSARGYETGHTQGFMKALIDESNDKIIGASILSMEGGEIAAALLIAMMGGLTYQQIRDGMFPHPTLAESLNNLFMTV